MTRVFVYGTLLAGEVNHGLLRGARPLGPRRARGSLHDLGGYPAFVPGGPGEVEGELYEVDADTLLVLDELEDCPRLYRREQVRLTDGSEAEAYMMRPEQVAGRARIASGSWRTHRLTASRPGY